MKLCASNIAWNASEDELALAALRREGVCHVEIAPTRMWPEWEGASASAAAAARPRLEELGFRVGAMQSLLFAKPHMSLFTRDPAQRLEMMDHFRLLADIAGELGAKALVFGSPKQRRREQMSTTDAYGIAVDVFGQVAEICAARDTFVALEANPVDYGCDFVSSAFEAATLVGCIAHSGMKLHLDTACMQLAGDTPALLVQRYADILGHVHVSAPYLQPVFSEVSAPHAALAQALRDAKYDGLVSLEMRRHDEALPAFERSVAFLRSHYGSNYPD